MLCTNATVLTTGGSDSMGPTKHQSDTRGPEGTMTAWLRWPVIADRIADVNIIERLS
jgi:hypothetical protein